MAGKSNVDCLRAFRTYLGASVVMHFAWEALQLPFYTIWHTGSSREIAFAVLHCTAGDLMIASLSLLAALILIGDGAWPAERFIPIMIAALVIGIGYTVYSEWLNTSVRKSWGYTELMPTLPWIGTGLSPLLQWLFVPVLAFAVLRRCPRARRL